MSRDSLRQKRSRRLALVRNANPLLLSPVGGSFLPETAATYPLSEACFYMADADACW